MILVAASVAGNGRLVSGENVNLTAATPTTPPARKHASGHHKSKAKAKAAETGVIFDPLPQITQTRRPRRTGRCDPTQQEQTDLSGTYHGTIKHGDEAATPATLIITGNNFRMSAGTDTHSGRITAVTTCGYTAVS